MTSRSLVAVTLCVAALATVPAGQSGPAPDAREITYASGGATIAAFVARPQPAPAKSPAVIVVHDDLGLNKATRDLAVQLAQAGFVALAPDLLSHGGAAIPGAAGARRRMTGALPVAQTVADVAAACAMLQQDAGVDASKVSAIGIGWGGFRVWRLAERTPTLYRGVIFYGVTPTDEGPSRVQAPMLAHYAEFDYLLTATALKTQKILGRKFTYYIYRSERGF